MSILFSTLACFSATSAFRTLSTEHTTNLIRVPVANGYDFTHKENIMAVTDTLFVTELDEESGEFFFDPPPALFPMALDARCPECGECLRQGHLDTEPPVPFTFCVSNCDLRGYAF